MFSNVNHYNILDFALAQSDNGQTWLSSATSSIITLKGMDISGTTNTSSINSSNAFFITTNTSSINSSNAFFINTNTSSINSSNASFDNLSIPINALSKDKITGLNTSLDNLSIDFIDPDGNNVNNNKQVIIPFDIQFYYPNLDDAVNELNGIKYV